MGTSPQFLHYDEEKRESAAESEHKKDGMNDGREVAAANGRGGSDGVEVIELEFCSLMVQSLNIILLTADSVHIQGLRDLVQNEHQLFLALFDAWCYDPISTLSLCLMSKMYELGAKLIVYFANVDITIGFLMQVDKLVTLIESPTFVHLRLELLEPYRNPYLLKIMYGLLMLLPQNNAFNSLRIRLQSASSFGLLQDENVNIKMANSGRTDVRKAAASKDIDIEKLFRQFVSVQDKFKKQRLRRQEARKIKNMNFYD